MRLASPGAFSTPEPEDKTGLQAGLARVAASFQNLRARTAEYLRQAKPLPTLLDFDKAWGHLAGSGEEKAAISLPQLLRRDFESLPLTLAELSGQGGVQPSH